MGSNHKIKLHIDLCSLIQSRVFLIFCYEWFTGSYFWKNSSSFYSTNFLTLDSYF